MIIPMKHSARTPEKREFEFGNAEFSFLAKLVSKQTGIVLAEHKRDMVYSRLARRLRALKLSSFTGYCELLQSNKGDEEMGNFINAITTNLTSFFREVHHFDHMREHVLKPIAKSPQKLRIWSAACSSGMEPYSIAMTVKSAIPDISKWDARILATDIDTNMLSQAKTGEYSDNELDNIPVQYRDHITGDDGQIFMPSDLKALITFNQLNLLQSWPMKGTFDIVFCRNVVIYFDKPTQRELFARIADVMKPGGWLYIGHSENLTNVCDRFELTGRTIYRRIS